MKSKKKKKSNILKYLVAVAVLVVVFVLIGKKTGIIGKKHELTVTVDKALLATIVEKVGATGNVQPITEVKVSPEVSGEIIELYIEEGDSVVQGQQLAKIRPDNWISQVDRMRAMLNQQRASLARAKAGRAKAKSHFIQVENNYKRQKDLYADKVISDSEYEQSKANYESAVSDLEAARQGVIAAEYSIASAKASLDDAEENLNKTMIYSPMSGTVSKLSVEKGETVVGTAQMAGTEMMRIADLGQMEVQVNVNENDIIRVQEGDTAVIEVDAYLHTEQKFEGVVTEIANTANHKASADSVTEFLVKIRILNESTQGLSGLEGRRMVNPFRPGMTASVEIITEKLADVLAVPLAAVTLRNESEVKQASVEEESSDGGKSEGKKTGKENKPSASKREEAKKEVVFVKRENKVEMVEVETGISDFDNIQILSGLKEGDKVVTGPFLVISKKLKHNSAVKTENEESDAEKE